MAPIKCVLAEGFARNSSELPHPLLSFQLLSMDSDPPFHKAYKTFFDNASTTTATTNNNNNNKDNKDQEAIKVIFEECELPLIDLRRLELGDSEGEECKSEIARASQEWGFFQVVNHGISSELLQKMKSEQEKVFQQSFDKKSQEHKYLNFSAGTYRWGSPTATSLRQLSWSEAFHIPLNKIFASSAAGLDDLSSTMEQFATTVSSLALKLAEILAEKLGHKSTFFHENCLPSTCYLRMNRYPPCPIPSEVFGLMPHTDSDFLTILHQDQVGGLQLVKDDRWIAVKPNPEALIINIGDLFQAWSNNVYKSVQHRVVTNLQVERFSTAYFFCPSYETMIESCCEPSVYRKFSFGEYRHQVQEDVKQLGSKVGLPRFLV
ncbi:gibberellin 2-beta-dioxygenase 8 isoform X3 [Rosa chinensis]|uniref:gibberellin 2-beta-dioxygenase 8 isoform X3 n=1 Tax=Rosa chinensis TaxID=74649 RepID=UPI001AD944ED|nr:gibberellin 2-beta-dioxygenase 8 isoform X3 [Rosa chinensis]